nr:immunoglobulin heavy chain junction region [Macaca mulatta]MOV36506.1 immunoglobulin heavy chain junction region [Macaca mulatta]
CVRGQIGAWGANYGLGFDYW